MGTAALQPWVRVYGQETAARSEILAMISQQQSYGIGNMLDRIRTYCLPFVAGREDGQTKQHMIVTSVKPQPRKLPLSLARRRRGSMGTPSPPGSPSGLPETVLSSSSEAEEVGTMRKFHVCTLFSVTTVSDEQRPRYRLEVSIDRAGSWA